MECAFCGVRSAAGYCVECRALVCAECGVVCRNCGRLVCREHVHELPRRRRVCIACYNQRNVQFERIITEMQEFARDVAERLGGDAAVFYDRLDDVLGQLRKLDANLRASFEQVEERVAARTQELEQEIRERERIERELHKAKAAAEKASRAKGEFLANMSHEIRTPMNGVIAMADLLLNTPLQPHQQQYAETIRSSGQSLLSIIGDILDYSKIEAGQLALDSIPFDLEVAIDDVVELLSARAEQQGLQIIVRYAPGTPRRFIGDVGRIRQVLMNLVGNALKFTEEGHVLVNAECLGIDGDRGIVRIAVEDTGIGIPEDKLPIIFNQFDQAEPATARKFGGTGLGLAICLQIVRLMGGRLGVKSTPGSGSRFRITLPLKVDRSEASAPSEPVDLANVRILIFEPAELNRNILLEKVNAWGMRGKAVATGEEAIGALRKAQARDDPFAIALISQNALTARGSGVGHDIKDDSQIQDTVLVLLTQAGQRGDATRMAEAGFAAYLSGPLEDEDFRKALAWVWAAQQRGEALGLVTRHTVAESRRQEDGQVELQDRFVHANVLVAEDNAVNQEVAREVLKSIGCTVKIASDGVEAVEKFRAGAYDIVFMDCQMPVMDGYAATREIRASEGQGEGVPIIAMTAHALKGDRERCLAAGMDDYISKPFTPDTVLTTIMRWFQSKTADTLSDVAANGERLFSTDGDRLFERVSELPLFNRDAAIAVSGGNAAILERVTAVFLESMPADMKKLGEAIANDRDDDARRLAHSLKSASASLGADRVSLLAKEMEQVAKRKDMDYARLLFDQLEHEFFQFSEVLEEVDWQSCTHTQ